MAARPSIMQLPRIGMRHLACDEERVEEAKLLVTQGASIYIENKEEKTPLQVAKGGLGLILKRIVESEAASM